MLESVYKAGERENTKKKVYDRLVEYLEIEGYPTEANVTDLVLYIIGPIISDFRRSKKGRDILLQREKEIIAKDSEAGGMEEFVVRDFISVDEARFVFVVEAKKTSMYWTSDETVSAGD